MTRPRPSVWRPLPLDDLLLGCAHYPEHVDETLWTRDAELMAAAGVNVVRMGEFAWHLWEPGEGRFQFDLFDRAVAQLGAYGIRTILGTPTATPPRWLTTAYPEVLRVDSRGRASGHGSRQHADTTSPVFRAHSRRVTAALAAHYRDNPHVIGWQTDNELNSTASESPSPSCRLAFQDWAAARYGGDIRALNRSWGGDVWALAYDAFDQIDLPRQLAPSFLSPGHVQDYHRFLADATAVFQRDQVEILRAANPRWFIFHNFGNPADVNMRGDFGRDLDFLGFDIYPFLYDEFRRWGGHAETGAMYLDLCRAHTGNFIVPEQAVGMGSQPGFATLTPEPGEMRRMALSSVARGADGILFFRWRPAHFGAEIYWTGLIDHDGTPRRRHHEASQVFRDLTALKDHLLGTHVRIDVGIAGADFDAQEAHKTYPLGLPSPVEDAGHLWRHCYAQGIPCGFIHPEDNLSPLKALYVPHWVMWKPEWTERLAGFAAAGGTVILSALTGTRDTDNHIPWDTAPAFGLSVLAGVKVTEFGRIAEEGADGLIPFLAEGFPGERQAVPRPAATSARRAHRLQIGNATHAASGLYEWIEPAEGTEILGRWSDRFLAGSPVLTRRRHGKGQVLYLGTYLTPGIVEALAAVVLAPAGVAPLLPDLPQGMEVTQRLGPDHALWFVLNTTDQTRQIADLPAGTNILTGAAVEGPLALEPYGCAVIRTRR